MAHDTAERSGDHAHPGELTEPGTDVSPQGMWQVLLGAAVAVLAPLFGFLGGTAGGADSPDDKVDVLLAWMIGGLVVGAVGALVAILGGLRWYHHLRARTARLTTDAHQSDHAPEAADRPDRL